MELSGRPLFDNPLDAALFVPREEGLRVEANCRDGINTLILGRAGTGKTSLLRNVLFQLRESEFPAVAVDGSSADDAEDLVKLVVAGLGRAQFGPPRIDLQTVGLGEVGSILDELRRLRGGQASNEERTAILVDLPPGAKAAHSLFGKFRDELWQLPYTWIVAAPNEMRVDLLTPPANAFFEDVIELKGLTSLQQEALVQRRLRPGETIPWRLPVEAEDNPRRLLAVLRESIRSGDAPDLRLKALADRDLEVAQMGRAASMLYTELQSYGPASASDDALLDRLGWSRQRAAQVLTELEQAGFVVAEQRLGPAGRPRKVFTIAPPSSS